jgi:hypothetical protein
MEKSYTVYLNSADKISGTNNRATFNVNWDDILDDSTDYYDRKEMKKFDDDALYYIDNDLYKKNIKADDLRNDIDALVKFYENAINNKIKKKLDLMKKEANSFKAKIK